VEPNSPAEVALAESLGKQQHWRCRLTQQLPEGSQSYPGDRSRTKKKAAQERARSLQIGESKANWKRSLDALAAGQTLAKFSLSHI